MMTRRDISPAVKAQAVQLVVTEGRSVMQVCSLLGVGPTALRRWADLWRAEQTSAPASPAQSQADRQRIAELQAEVNRLTEERDLLKKSIAFFVRESDRPKR
jgi:transposase